MFSKAKNSKVHMSSSMKASSFIATCLHQVCNMHQVCMGMSHSHSSIPFSLPCAPPAQCTNETRRKRNSETKSKRGNIRKINGTKRSWKAKQQDCPVPLGTVTWQMAQDFYYFITSGSHARAGSSILGSLLLHTFWPFFCKKFLLVLFRVPPFAFAGVVQFLSGRENMPVCGI